ncbi:ROK family transcriptional regulator [Nakamurella sp. A5-74]|uniref:ROK family transcriptional regulator n=1 Tax=Nakamurella sp. A5-74 TaxID=3158264 RepID=A0AAU8DNT8_9ACTN
MTPDHAAAVPVVPVVAARRSADSPRVLREINDRVVLDLLLEHGPMTRGRVGQLSSLSKPTVSSLLTRLAQRGLVTTTGVAEGGPGPNARIYAVDPSAGHVLVLHVEQHGSVATLADITGAVVAAHAVEVPSRRASDPAEEARRAIDGVLAAAALPASAVRLLMIVTPGVIDPVTGRLRHARHLHGWEESGLPERLSAEFGMQVRYGNDVNLAAVAEGRSGAARGRSDYALLWLGRGVGLGLVLDGRVRLGAHGGAGEIGYLPVPGVEHPRVDRGGAGAFQQLVGGQGLRALAKRHGIRSSNVPEEVVRSALLAAESGGHALLAELAEGIAQGVSAVTALIDPGLLVIGGPVAAAGGAELVDLVRAAMAQWSFVRPEIVASQLAGDGVVAGAVEEAVREIRETVFGDAGAEQSSGTGA